MGECIITRRGGDKPTLPVLNENYPQDKSISFIQGNNGTTSFNIVIQEDGKPAEYTYQWYLDGSAVSGATSDSYTWSGTASGTHYIYCTATNKAGTVTSRTATLSATMYYKPVLNSSYPANQTVEYGGSASFSVNISTAGNPSTYTYQWYKDNAAISGATGSSYTASGWSSGSYTIYCAVTNSAGTVNSRAATYVVGSASPTFTYSGSYSGGTADSSGNWQITFTSGGTLKFTNRGTGINGIDVFVVGGGAGGKKSDQIGAGGGGGGGGKTTTKKGVSIAANTNYTITIAGAVGQNTAGGTSSATFGNTKVEATGGSVGAGTWNCYGGAGGSGGGSGGFWDGTRKPGNGGTNGGNGSSANAAGGAGQGSTTTAFASGSGTAYAGGGAGGRSGPMRYDEWSSAASGGATGGGDSGAAGSNGYGGGGGGGAYKYGTYYNAGGGGSGVIIIRNKR